MGERREGSETKERVALQNIVGDLKFAMGSESRLRPYCGRFEVL